MTLQTAREWLTRLGMPATDPATAPASARRFADGGWYKWEVAGALDASAVASAAARLGEHGVRLHQVTNTVGIMRYLDTQIDDLVSTCRELGIQLRMSVGPRGVYDIGGQARLAGGVAAASAYRLRGAEQLARALADVARALDLGVRGFLVFDEGLLAVLHQLRQRGEVPAELRLKASSGMGAGNPAHVRVLASLGADSVNLQRDLDLPMIAAVRAATEIALDLHTDNPASTGGFIRTYDVPEMVRLGAPVYLKSGNAAQRFSEEAPDSRTLDAITHQILLDHHMLTRHFAEAIPSDQPEF